MKRIVRGNDFVLRIPVTKKVNGQMYDFPLVACSELHVALVNQYRKYCPEYSISTDASNVILARVEGDKLPCGRYALEVRGKLFRSDWRSYEYSVITLVENNGNADTEFDVTDEGENSVEIDTQIVVMGASVPAINPRGEWDASAEYKRGDAVSHGLKCWWAENDNTASEPADGNADWVVLVDATPLKDELQGAAEGATEAAAAATEAAAAAAEATEKASAAAEKAEASATTADASAEKANAAAEKAEKAAEGAGGCDCPVESGSGAGSVQSKGYTDEGGNEVKGGTASGGGAVALGLGSTASGGNSFAEGTATQALGQGAHAEGWMTTAGSASGMPGAHAEGFQTKATGGSSHAEGEGTTASGNQSHAEGTGTTASANYSHSEGYSTQALVQGTHAEGYQTVAGSGSASGMPGAHAEGLSTTASGGASHAEGQSTTASGSQSHAEGMSTKATEEESHAEGYQSQALGNASHAEGYRCKATHVGTHAEGSGSTASGAFSHAEGESTTASGRASHAEGKCNKPSELSIHSVGIGEGTNNRKNAEDIYYDTSSAKNGYKYLIGIGGYDGTNFSTFDEEDNETLNTEIKSVQEVIAELQESGGGSGSVEAITEDTINALS